MNKDLQFKFEHLDQTLFVPLGWNGKPITEKKTKWIKNFNVSRLNNWQGWDIYSKKNMMGKGSKTKKWRFDKKKSI